MAIVGNLTPSPVPAGDTLGSVPMVMYHVTIAPASGAGTYTFAHGLKYTPTAVYVVPENTQGTTPTLLASFDVADTNGTSVAVNVSGNGTYDVYYG